MGDLHHIFFKPPEKLESSIMGAFFFLIAQLDDEDTV